MEEIIKNSIYNKLSEFDLLGSNYGPHMEWKKDWTRLARAHYYLFIFSNNSFGHALYKTKFQFVPAIKKMFRW